ncbi:MAG: alpha/beta fold hydrolase [Actinomycetaceae bacterium]|nr:alpha/beta fold hydrolase [Actinomycetaceae bacterium]
MTAFSYRSARHLHRALSLSRHYSRIFGRRQKTPLRAWPASVTGESYVSIERHQGYFVRVYRLYHADKAIGPLGRNHVPTFVLIHGIGVSARYFIPLARQLRLYGNVLLMDLPGFSNLPKPKRAISIAGFAAVIHSVIRRENISYPIILGHSMGTQFVTELSVRAPQLASRIMLLGPPVDTASPTVAQVGVRFIRSSLFEPFKLGMLATRAYAKCGITWFSQILPTMMNYPIEQRIESVKANIVLARGEHDAVAPSPWLHLLSQRYATLRSKISDKPIDHEPPPVITINNAAHSVIHDHAADVAAHLVKLGKENSNYTYHPATPNSQTHIPSWAQTRPEHLKHALAVSYANTQRNIEPANLPLHALRKGADKVLALYGKCLDATVWATTAFPDYAVFCRQLLKALPFHTPVKVNQFQRHEELDDKTLPTVILIHGLAESYRAMNTIAQALHVRGYTVISVPSARFMRQSIDDLSEIIHNVIRDNDIKDCILVAHSKGGLVAKCVLAKQPQLIRGVIALATPWMGSTMTRFIPWRSSIHELSCDSSTIRALAQSTKYHSRIVSLSPQQDEQIPSGTWLRGAINRQIPIRGHQRILDAPASVNAVCQAVALLTTPTN